MTVAIRPAGDADAADFIAIVGACWREYPGCVVDIDGEAPELHALASAMAARGGAAWAATTRGDVVGLVAAWPAGAAWELGKMYVDAASRGTGAATLLLRAAEDHARRAGAGRLRLWSDTRFSSAHAFYERHGFLRDGPIRSLNDRSNSIEFGYAKPLGGVAVQVLDAAAAASAVRGLADLLVACVADGDGGSISFMPPLARDVARAFWSGVATQVATGRRILVAAWLDGALSGVVTVGCDTPPNQPHRADVQKLMVVPSARRRGVARALMLAAERAARAAGRTLLVLDTRDGDAAERLYRSLGYVEVGAIPGYAMTVHGTAVATVLFYKFLA